MHCGASSRLDVLIGKWVPIGDCWLGLHMALCMSGTWSSHPNRQQYAWTICGRLWHIARARCPKQKQGVTWVSPDAVVVQTIGVPFKENVCKTTCISKRIILPLFYLYTHIFGLLWKLSPDESISIILEYTSSNHVKLLDCLSDLLEPLINQVSSEVSWDAPPWPVDTWLSASMSMVFCLYSFFCKKGKSLKPKHCLLRKQLQRWRPC